ncbi:MAG: NADH-quinone oxidoreductase subunit C, partial [Pseudomonadales bacterium]|nr:NADH-quinone oxidoreductase subunit C [Pseudomonadales bacterium]
MPAVAQQTRAGGGESAAHRDTHIAEDLATHFGPECVTQECVDGIRTVWVPKKHVRQVIRYLKYDAPARFELMFDLSAIDERARQNRDGQPASEFTVFYHLMSLSSDDDVRIKVALADGESVD